MRTASLGQLFSLIWGYLSFFAVGGVGCGSGQTSSFSIHCRYHTAACVSHSYINTNGCVWSNVGFILTKSASTIAIYQWTKSWYCPPCYGHKLQPDGFQADILKLGGGHAIIIFTSSLLYLLRKWSFYTPDSVILKKCHLIKLRMSDDRRVESYKRAKLLIFKCFDHNSVLKHNQLSKVTPCFLWMLNISLQW